MKKIFTLAITLMCIFTLSAQEQAPKQEKAKKVKEAFIEFEKTTHNYGEVYQGGDGICEFVFKNTGKAPLVLSNVRSSCGCTVPEWPKEPIPPKKTAVIKVKYDTHRIGGIHKSITVESNATNNRVILNIEGNVVDKPAEKAPVNTQSSLAAPGNN
jgi:Protein of unknown function (DUF1573).